MKGLTFHKSDINISTAVCIVDTNHTFDISKIYSILDIDSTIKGIKYGTEYRGDIIHKKACLYNQASINMYLKSFDKYINLKLFSNGKVQLSGVKCLEHCQKCITVLLEKLKPLHGQHIINVITINNVIYDKNLYDTHQNVKKRFASIKLYNTLGDKIGERNGSNIILTLSKSVSVIDYIRNDYFFIDAKNTKITDKIARKNVYHKHTGILVGYILYTFPCKIKNIEYTKYIIQQDNENTYNIMYENFYKDKILLCVETIFIDSVKLVPFKNDCISKKYICSDMVKDRIDYLFTNINANFRIYPFVNINRNLFNNVLIQKLNVNSCFTPETKYPAIKVKIYFDKNLEVIPFDKINSDKDFMYSNSISIFENGQILTFGSMSLEQIDKVAEIIVSFFNDAQQFDEIVKKEPIKIEIKDPNLDIWDFL